jgi:hypothetical protein
MATYPEIPFPPAPHVDEPRAHYGARLFAWIIETGVTVTLDDDALELATYAGRRAMTAARYLASLPAPGSEPARRPAAPSWKARALAAERALAELRATRAVQS